MRKYWLVKIAFMFLALAGVLWMMQSLSSGSYFKDPNSPVQLFLGPGEGASAPDSGSESREIPAKVITQPPKDPQR